MLEKVWTSWGSWEGRRCFVIGGGPSLTNFDFSLLKDELTVGINKAYTRVHPTVILSIDEKGFWYWRRYDHRVLNHPLRVWPAPLNRRWQNPYSIYRYDIDPIVGDNSGYQGMRFAYRMGANPIYLLGFDMTPGHWHGGYKAQTSEPNYEQFIETFKQTEEEIASRVVNLNPSSKIERFEFDEFENIY